MSTSIVLNADSFSDATDAFRVRCTVPILVCLSEQDIATQPAPPHLAFKVPETSVISSLSRPIHEGFRRYLAEPNQAPLFWLSRDAAGKDPVPWSMPTGLLAQYVQHEKDLDDDDASAQAHNKFKKVHVVFPIKLCPSNFDPSNWHPSDLDPSNFDPSNFDGSQFFRRKSEGVKFVGSE